MLRKLLVCAVLMVGMVSAGEVLSTDSGRYVFGRLGDGPMWQFMLDTQTGQLWVMVEREEAPKYVLIPVQYSDGRNGLTIHPPKTGTPRD